MERWCYHRTAHSLNDRRKSPTKNAICLNHSRRHHPGSCRRRKHQSSHAALPDERPYRERSKQNPRYKPADNLPIRYSDDGRTGHKHQHATDIHQQRAEKGAKHKDTIEWSVFHHTQQQDLRHPGKPPALINKKRQNYHIVGWQSPRWYSINPGIGSFMMAEIVRPAASIDSRRISSYMPAIEPTKPTGISAGY